MTSTTPPPPADPSPFEPPQPGTDGTDPYAAGPAAGQPSPSPYGSAPAAPSAPYGAPPASPYAAPPAPGTDGLAITALVTGILCLTVIPIAFGIAALRRIKRTGRSGRGMAIAGIVLGAVSTVGWGVFIALLSMVVSSEEFQESFSEAYEEAYNSAAGFELGECFDPPSDLSSADVARLDCAEPHVAEVVGVDLLTQDEFPGETTVDSDAVDFCYAAFAEYVGIDFDTSSLDMGYFYPTEESWALGDRQVACWAQNVDGSPLEASVKGSGL